MYLRGITTQCMRAQVNPVLAVHGIVLRRQINGLGTPPCAMQLHPYRAIGLETVGFVGCTLERNYGFQQSAL